MIKAIMRGCNGRMGQMISGIVKDTEGIEIVAGIDLFDEGKNSYPVYKKLAECTVEADVVIDFASPDMLDDLLETSVERKMAIVLCSTGFSDVQLELIKKASERIAILRSANMSFGINMLLKVLQKVAGTLDEAGFDIEIVEKHHNRKLDAPSGTALALADAINQSLQEPYEYVFDRSGRREKRPKTEIGLSAVRGGTIVGEHEIIFAGCDEVIEIKHTAYSRAVFGNGAVQAAKYLAGKDAGMYSMSDVVKIAL